MLPSDPLSTLFVVVLVAQVLALVVLSLWLATGGRCTRARQNLRRRGWMARFDRLAARPAGSLATVFVVSLAFCGMLGLIHQPVPRIHDEFAYLLAADTFAHGRLTNPPPPPEIAPHLESEHILVRPTYASKYPPAQGLALAAGQVVFGWPLVGAWFSTAAASAAVCWMLRAWMPPRWALIGGLLVATHPGFVAWWGHSFWGGSLATLGGALVFGAVRRAAGRDRLLDGICLGVGLALLASTRPLEGFAASIPAGLALATVWWRKARENPRGFRNSCVRVGLPTLIVVAGAAAWMARYNQAVTGSPTTMPYREHWKQYCATPLFVFQKPPPPPTYRDRKLRDFHQGWELDTWKQQQGAKRMVSKALQKTGILWGFYFGPPLSVGLAGLLLRNRRARSAPRDGWIVFAMFAIGSTLSLSFACVWFHAFYVAPIAGLLFLMALVGMRRVRASGERGRALVAAGTASHVAGVFAATLGTPIVHAWWRGADWSVHRAELQAGLIARGGRHLVIQRHGRDCIPFQEWVYNQADPDRAPVVWSRELESTSVPTLLEHYADRTVWLLHAYRSFGDRAWMPELEPYPRGPAWLYGKSQTIWKEPAAAVAVLRDAAGKPASLAIAPAGKPEIVLRECRGTDWGETSRLPMPWPTGKLARTDFDGDGLDDLAAAAATGPELVVLRKRKGDGFDPPVPHRGVGVASAMYVSRGLTGPILCVTATGSDGSPKLAAFTLPLQDGDADEPADMSVLGIGPTASADLDQDGREELIVTRPDKDEVVIHPPPGSDRPLLTLATGVHPTGVIACDIDRDSLPDLAISTRHGHGLTVLRNLGGAPTLRFEAPIDVTLGGTTWFAEKSNGVAAGDLDGDGIDELLVATVWGVEVLWSRNPAGAGSPKPE